MPQHIDQTGRRVLIPENPVRIVSLVPSITEYLADIGLADHLVGITKFCIHPEKLHNNVFQVGGTKDFKVEKVRHVKPDLVVANREENDRILINQIAEHFPVWVSQISNVEGALEMMTELGKITNRNAEASNWTEPILKAYVELHPPAPAQATALYLIWRKPYMAAGTDTFINDILSRLGFQNSLQSFGKAGERYPELSKNDIAALQPDYIFLSSEPYPFKQKHIEELQQFAQKSTLLVDGEAFSWYGSRMLKSYPYLIQLKKELTG